MMRAVIPNANFFQNMNICGNSFFQAHPIQSITFFESPDVLSYLPFSPTIQLHVRKTDFSREKHGLMSQGFSNFFCSRPQKLFLKIWRPSKNLATRYMCKIHSKKALFRAFLIKKSQIQNLATPFCNLATLKRVATPSLRTAALTE